MTLLEFHPERCHRKHLTQPTVGSFFNGANPGAMLTVDFFGGVVLMFSRTKWGKCIFGQVHEIYVSFIGPTIQN